MKEIVTEKAPKAIGPYSQALDLGEWVICSGSLPVNPETGEVPQGIEEETRQSMLNIKAILEEAGLSLKNIVKTTIYLSDMNDFAKMNEVYASFFEKPYPTRSAIQVARLPKDVKVEIEAWARKDV